MLNGPSVNLASFKIDVPDEIYTQLLSGFPVLVMVYLLLPEKMIDITTFFNWSLPVGISLLACLASLVVGTISNCFPTETLQRAYSNLPKVPKYFHKEIVNESIYERFCEACDQLFFSNYCSNDIHRYRKVKQEATEYLLNNGVDRIQLYKIHIKIFTRLWFTSIIGIVSTFAIYHKNVIKFYKALLDKPIIPVAIIILIICIFSLLDELVGDYTERYLNHSPFYIMNYRTFPSILTLLIISGLITFVLGLAGIPKMISYTTNLEMHLGSSPHIPIVLFFSLSLLFYYNIKRSQQLMMKTTFKNLYHVALSEGDIKK